MLPKGPNIADEERCGTSSTVITPQAAFDWGLLESRGRDCATRESQEQPASRGGSSQLGGARRARSGQVAIHNGVRSAAARGKRQVTRKLGIIVSMGPALVRPWRTAVPSPGWTLKSHGKF